MLRRIVRISLLVLFSPLFLLRVVLAPLLKRDVLVLQLADSVPDHAAGDGAWRRFVPRQTPKVSLDELLVGLAEAGEDDKIKTVLLVLDRPQLALIQAEQLLEAIDRVKAAGKKVLVWADGLGAPVLVVAAAADECLGVPEGQLEFLGLRVRAMFVHDLLELLGVVPQLDRHGDYKTMADMFNRRTMSEAHREMSTELGGDLFEQCIAPLIMGRQLTREQVLAVLDEGPLANVTAVEQKVLDGVAYRDELSRRAGFLGGSELKEDDEDDQPSRCELGLMLARRRRREWLGRVLRDPPSVRVIHLKGTIVPGETGRGCPSRALVRCLEEAQEQASVKAVVLRIDSPGGSALASDEIWRALKRLDGKKPVVASLARVAASGGYYSAVGARKIVAHAATITGSIGIVSGKFHLGPALFRWGVRMEGVEFGARAGMLDPHRGFSEAEREHARAEMMRFYRTFLERVAEGRGMTTDEVDALAQGKVYTGRRALGLKLVDEIGSFQRAVELAAELGEVRRPFRVEHIHPARRGLAGMLGAEGRAVDVALSGLAALETAAVLAREPALAYCPWRVDGV